MFCEKCGGKLIEKKKHLVCPTCSAKFPLDYSICYFKGNNNSETAVNTASKRFSFKDNILVIVIAAVLALSIGGTAIGISISAMPANRVSRYMTTAERYLSEMNYEQAVIEFERILEIEPMNVDAYLGLANAYLGLGEREKALEILRKGAEVTGDSRIIAKINELTKPAESSNTPVSSSIPASSSMPQSSSSSSSSSSSEPQTSEPPIVEEPTVKLSFSDIGVTPIYIEFGHYIGRDGELWRPCDANGRYISDKKFKYIENFCGTTNNSYSIVTYENGKVAVVDKGYNETFEINNPDKYAISKQNEPLILSWHIKEWNNENDKDSLKIYSSNGNLLYKWNSGEYTDGSGKSVDINDPALPNEAKNFECTEEYHKNLWVDSITNSLFEYAGISVSGDEIYVPFCFEITYDYDKTEEDAAYEKEKQEALDRDGFWIGAHNSHSHYSTASIVYTLKLERGELIWQKSELLSDYTPWSYSMGESIVIQDDDFVIVNVIYPTSNTRFSLLSGNTRKGFTSRSDYSNNYDLTNVNFNYVNRFVNKDLMICGKYTDETRKNARLALFKINWLDTTVNNSAEEKILNEGHKRISDFYDSISYTDSDLELGYALVSKDGKWGYVSLKTGEELAMFDDASNFSNGYAVVTNNGIAHVIDSNFEPVLDEFPCEGASGLGDGAFAIRVGGKTQRLEIVR